MLQARQLPDVLDLNVTGNVVDLTIFENVTVGGNVTIDTYDTRSKWRYTKKRDADAMTDHDDALQAWHGKEKRDEA